MNSPSKHRVDPALDFFRITMVCDDLKRVPHVGLPGGFHMRHYLPGDAYHWTRIHLEAEPYHKITSDTFAEKFGADDSLLKQRQLYACTADGTPVGTATAWFDNQYHGERWGRVHWVAVLPQFQGLGIGRALVSQVCKVMIALGDSRAYLATQACRIRAIKLYYRLGFVPEIRTPEDREAWRHVQQLASTTGFEIKLEQR